MTLATPRTAGQPAEQLAAPVRRRPLRVGNRRLLDLRREPPEIEGNLLDSRDRILLGR